MFVMHWGILLLMGITFSYYLCGAAFVPFVIRRFDRGATDATGAVGRTNESRALSSVAVASVE